MKAIKIAITGGPSGGKTTLIETLKKEFGSKVDIVPEAASILYKGGFPRLKTDRALVHTQMAIYHTQRELEEIIGYHSNAKILVCDRGSLDSAAYWPNAPHDFFTTLNTSKDAELKRYPWVLHLDTAGVDSYDTSNPIRTETYAEAKELNEKIKDAWSGHPQRIVIGDADDFFKKMGQSIHVIRMIQNGKTVSEIQQWLNSNQN